MISKNFKLIQFTATALYLLSLGALIGALAGAHIGGIYLWLTVMTFSGILLVAVKIGDADIAKNERKK